jgi:hypothetical protein
MNLVMLSVIVLCVILLTVGMLSVTLYAECHFTECRGALKTAEFPLCFSLIASFQFIIAKS